MRAKTKKAGKNPNPLAQPLLLWRDGSLAKPGPFSGSWGLTAKEGNALLRSISAA